MVCNDNGCFFMWQCVEKMSAITRDVGSIPGCYFCGSAITKSYWVARWCDKCAVARKCFGCCRPDDDAKRKERHQRVPGWNPMYNVFVCGKCFDVGVTCQMCKKCTASAPALFCTWCYSDYVAGRVRAEK